MLSRMDDFMQYLRAGGGAQKRLASEIGVSPALVWQWAHGHRPIAAHHCRTIERATAGRFRAEQLRPDVFLPVVAHDNSKSRSESASAS
jgi:DNA-binding transcriptional regulator YdaS (Cro superfamily)